MTETTKKKDAKKYAWQSLPLNDLGVSPAIMKLLEDAGCETIGKLNYRMVMHEDFWATDIKGLGEDAAAKVSDGFRKFWADHPEYC